MTTSTTKTTSPAQQLPLVCINESSVAPTKSSIHEFVQPDAFLLTFSCRWKETCYIPMLIIRIVFIFGVYSMPVYWGIHNRRDPILINHGPSWSKVEYIERNSAGHLALDHINNTTCSIVLVLQAKSAFKSTSVVPFSIWKGKLLMSKFVVVVMILPRI